MMPDFRDKVVVVTGASRGIGAKTAEEFARCGASVVLVARTLQGLQDTAKKCVQAGATENKVLIYHGDITQAEHVKKVPEATLQRFGKIDILVNNAGSVLLSNLESATVEDLDSMYNIHVKAVFSLTKSCLPSLLLTKGNIVNVSSFAGIRPMPSVITYTMAKAALEQFTKAASLDLAAKGVRVNAVCPAVIKTTIFSQPGAMVENESDLPEFFASNVPAHPMGRVGEVQEVAKAILFLASDDASFTTGCCLPIDGGRSNTST